MPEDYENFFAIADLRLMMEEGAARATSSKRANIIVMAARMARSSKQSAPAAISWLVRAVALILKHHCQLHQQDRTVGRKLKNFMVTFVVSPSYEESANFTMDDWARLQDEFLEVLDSVGLTPKGMKGKVKTNFRHSMNVGGLH